MEISFQTYPRNAPQSIEAKFQ